jgi:hypothetical protein
MHRQQISSDGMSSSLLHKAHFLSDFWFFASERNQGSMGDADLDDQLTDGWEHVHGDLLQSVFDE